MGFSAFADNLFAGVEDHVIHVAAVCLGLKHTDSSFPLVFALHNPKTVRLY